MRQILVALIVLFGVSVSHGSIAPLDDPPPPPLFEMIPSVSDYEGVDSFFVSISVDKPITELILGLAIVEGGGFDSSITPTDDNKFENFKPFFDTDGYDLKLVATEEFGIDPVSGTIIENIKFDLDVTGNPFTIKLFDIKNYASPLEIDEITYVPEPLSLSLLVIGGLVLQRRKMTLA